MSTLKTPADLRWSTPFALGEVALLLARTIDDATAAGIMNSLLCSDSDDSLTDMESEACRVLFETLVELRPAAAGLARGEDPDSAGGPPSANVATDDGCEFCSQSFNRPARDSWACPYCKKVWAGPYAGPAETPGGELWEGEDEKIEALETEAIQICEGMLRNGGTISMAKPGAVRLVNLLVELAELIGEDADEMLAHYESEARANTGLASAPAC